MDVFLSVGGTANELQESFVQAVEARLRSEGLTPKTVGRSHFSSDAPLKAVNDLLDKCAGTIVIALERIYIQQGLERRSGPSEKPLSGVSLTTPWNQIEAALSYSRARPLLVIVANEIRPEGLLEAGYDWYVQRLDPKPESLNTVEFNGILADWKRKLNEAQHNAIITKPRLATMSIGDIISQLKPSELAKIIGSIVAFTTAIFALGAWAVTLT
ncbi:hypothetical protein D5301_24000 [Stenotrophomonas sp. MH181796]|uniref:hypothetical protein n=1 Tax=Stenotrophomonas TaxID=40323 RepID=UPI00129CE1B0|nr:MULTISPECIES: hypothetical protein [unclassified Stenotrophomonas]MRI45261.1 hypothetical protein [Stenotrophomonas sp. MH181796]